MKLPFHEATTAQLGAVYPFVASSPLPVDGVFVGRDLFGGIFVHDPFDLYAAKVITNPNMAIFGQIGRGKSALVKTYLYRHAAFGRRIIVLDPKGEYGPLARALGVEPIKLLPGGSTCLNPLETHLSAESSVEQAALRQMEVVIGVASACLSRTLHPTEHAALEAAVTASRLATSTPTLTHVVEQLFAPTESLARDFGGTAQELRDDGRDVALELRRFIRGDQRGMFDGPTSKGVDLGGSVVVVDLSALYRSPSLGALMTCVAAALESTWRRSQIRQTILVIDEAWAVLSNLGAARFFQSSWKLARSHGVANIAVLHRISDLSSSGESGSMAAQIAEGLLSDCETVVSYGQSSGEIEQARRVLGLDEVEARLLTQLRRGVALWRVGDRPFVVEHRLGKFERELVDTDEQLLGAYRDRVRSDVP